MQIQAFDLFAPLLGGALIGLAASLVLLAHGKVTGISGIFGGLLESPPSDTRFRGWFLFGLLLSGLLARVVSPGIFSSLVTADLGIIAIAGVFVGFGTRLGSGCTSGHGVCGLSRLSPRSFVATLTFIATGMLAVFAARHFGAAT